MMLAMIPDIAALGALLLLLDWLRRRHPQQRFGLWLAGLLLIFTQEIARALFPLFEPAQPLLGAIAYNCYAVAGSIFFWGSFPARFPRPEDRRHLLVSVPPLMAFLTLFTLDVTSHTPFYLCIAAGLVTGIWTIVRLRLSPVLFATRIAVLCLMTASVHHGDLLLATHIPLAYTYAICAWSFSVSLPRPSLGRLVIVTGFCIWSLCFITYPWVVNHPAFSPFADEVWAIQCFAVSFGMLLVVFEQQVERNKHLALHDQLTGLPNRRLFDDRLLQATLQANRTGQRVAVMMLDLDGFKTVNDAFGHTVGDRFLCEVARTLRQSLRSYNTMARLGGDEFGIISPDLVPFAHQARSAADAIAASLHTALAHPISIQPHTLPASCSIGVAIYPDDAVDLDQLLHIADLRMYEHKRTRPDATGHLSPERQRASNLQPTSAV